MREWLKDHILEIASIVLTVFGVRWLVDLWSQICVMFIIYTKEVLLVCALSAFVAAIITAFISRKAMRRMVSEREAEFEKQVAEKYGEMERLIGDDGVADTLRSYRSLKESGGDVNLVVRQHVVAHIKGERESIEIAKRDLRINELERRIDEQNKLLEAYESDREPIEQTEVVYNMEGDE